MKAENNLLKYFIGTREEFISWKKYNPGEISEKMICFIHPKIEDEDKGEGWIYTRGVFFEMKKANIDVKVNFEVESGDNYLNVEQSQRIDEETGKVIEVRTLTLSPDSILNKDSEILEEGEDDKLITKGYLKKVIELNKEIEKLN